MTELQIGNEDTASDLILGKEQTLTAQYPPNLRRREASRYLRERYGICAESSTLAKWFCQKSDGPPAFKDGRVPLYPRHGLDEWASRRLGPLRRSTSEIRSA